ncbi:putative tellurite resistance protein B-like protein [Vibrio crassostreae]|uniref:tellurite resistance TerB family protein n=1 Tax=Vibrio crassostreae TaxID=246167 RepID=UPI0005DC2061|nr:TerB family tellurite resistance protein [Vibrio crassostreae]TCT60222.1 putative tellurite resistance protein B-like protein [Vibrio crassostreae]TCT81948.1 putative tellurite resistance protein B-like protein [Vibrio crassostreae]TCU02790.1 putative tellurite resistance protein B-like protein [Vibrio crassostreae]TDW09323.1 putative tellurite resistance protein B-like protein [Vibrio crassostreae]CAK1695441.1 putative tellurite resistance protein B-like protein [Vibrio crassostreae]
MFNSLTSMFKQLIEGQDLSKNQGTSPNIAIASLLCEVAGADHQINESERVAKLQLLQRLLDLDEEQAKVLLAQAEPKVEQSVSLYDFTSQLRDLSQPVRIDLIKAMWEVAHADGEIDPIEESVIRKTAELLYVDHSDFIKTKLNVLGKS